MKTSVERVLTQQDAKYLGSQRLDTCRSYIYERVAYTQKHGQDTATQLYKDPLLQQHNAGLLSE